MKLIKNFFISGHKFDKNDTQLRGRYQMINIGLLISSIGLIFGIAGNFIMGIHGFIPLEVFILSVNIIIFIVMRKSRALFVYVPIVITSLFLFLFLFLLYMSNPASFKFLWLFTYPIVTLFFHNSKKGFYWFVAMLIGILIAPLQPFIEVQFSMYQVVYLSFVLFLISIITYFYQIKMSEANARIIQQQEELEDFNLNLEKEIKEKISELQNLNDSLEIKVEEKIQELRAKDKILEAQSKQAVMGEMISMIAHQWRQPLSTITLQIANLQFKKLLGQKLSSEETENALSEISDTIIYLSDTIDDFQTYFHPNKELKEVEINKLLTRAVNFAKSRISKNNIEITLCENCTHSIKTYPNEFVQVVLNILNNAIDAHNELKTKNARIEMDVNIEDDHLIVDISDNAGGIDKKNLSKLFEPYFSTKGKNGTGLGLYMSQMIVQKQFGGELSVKTSTDGSTFTINIPKT